MAIQTYFMLSLRIALYRFVGEHLMDSVTPYLVITSVVFSLCFIMVEIKLNTKVEELPKKSGLLKDHIVLYFGLGFTLQYFAATKVQVNYDIQHDFYCEISSGIVTGIFISLTGARSLVSVIGPTIFGIALFIMSKQDLMSDTTQEITAIMVTVGKTMSVVLFYSSLPFLVSPSIYPLGYGIAYSFV